MTHDLEFQSDSDILGQSKDGNPMAPVSIKKLR